MRQLIQDLTLKKLIIYVLVTLMYGVVLLSIIELGRVLIQDVFSTPVLVLDSSELIDLLGLFLLVLVAFELLDTIRVYLSENEVHAEVVIEAALIAIARKVILLDLKSTPPVALLGLGVILISLAAGFYVLRLTHGKMGGHQTAGAGLAPGE